MSWAATITAGVGAAGSLLGGKGGGGAPAAPISSGGVQFGDVNFTPKQAAGNSSGAVVVIVTAAVVVLTLGLGLLWLKKSRKR